jgi:hypothetical protein
MNAAGRHYPHRNLTEFVHISLVAERWTRSDEDSLIRRIGGFWTAAVRAIFPATERYALTMI